MPDCVDYGFCGQNDYDNIKNNYLKNELMFCIIKLKKTGGAFVNNRIYAAIDLKSFYASVECVERGLDPLTTNLVVADPSRTEKTICLAVSPSLKAYGIPGRPRLFEVVQKAGRRGVEYIVAPPRMALYMEYSTRIYSIYLHYVAPEDIFAYSVDEVFIDMTSYLKTYEMSPRELVIKMIKEVLDTTGITATAGIGTNMYLCKVAMDIVAKKATPDKDGVRIAELDEMSYRKLLWNHRPITDFWRVGPGYAKKLEQHMLYTMGDVARCSVGDDKEYYNEALLYKLFGVNAELLIDHSWGYEPCTMADVKSYRPENNSLSQGQVLQSPYTYDKAGLIVKEMTDILVLDLVDKGLVTNQIVLTIGYDIESLNDSEVRKRYRGEITKDRYGRSVPKHAHGTINLERFTSSTRVIIKKTMELYNRIIDKSLLVRRINVVANHVMREEDVVKEDSYRQLDIFTNYEELERIEKEQNEEFEKERHIQEATIEIKKKFGKNALLKGMNFEEGATARDRNRQIGGHKA